MHGVGVAELRETAEWHVGVNSTLPPRSPCFRVFVYLGEAIG